MSLPSSPVSERVIGIATVIALHLAVGVGLMLFAQPVIQALMGEPVHIQLVSEAAEKLPEPPTPGPPKVRPMESRPRQTPQTPQPQPVPVLQTQAQTPSNVPVMEAPPPPREMPQAAIAQPVSNPAPPAPPAPVTPPRFDADYLDNPQPPYPRASLSLREEGRVLLRVQVGEDGRPLQVLIFESSGFQRLDRAARDTVASAWRFVPAHQGGKPVVEWTRVPISFELR